MFWNDRTSHSSPSLTITSVLLGLLARIRRQVRERGGDIVRVIRSGAALDRDIAATLAEAQRRRRRGTATVLTKAGVTDPRQVDVPMALMADEACDQLVDVGGWTYDEYERWLTTTFESCSSPDRWCA